MAATGIGGPARVPMSRSWANSFDLARRSKLPPAACDTVREAARPRPSPHYRRTHPGIHRRRFALPAGQPTVRSAEVDRRAFASTSLSLSAYAGGGGAFRTGVRQRGPSGGQRVSLLEECGEPRGGRHAWAEWVSARVLVGSLAAVRLVDTERFNRPDTSQPLDLLSA